MSQALLAPLVAEGPEAFDRRCAAHFCCAVRGFGPTGEELDPRSSKGWKRRSTRCLPKMWKKKRTISGRSTPWPAS